ncbi:MAG: hypothetical protein WC570_04940 [Patescibacteria group bacterium]
MGFCLGGMKVGRVADEYQSSFFGSGLESDKGEEKYEQYRKYLVDFKEQLKKNDISGAKETLGFIDGVLKFDNIVHDKKEQMAYKNYWVMRAMVGEKDDAILRIGLGCNDKDIRQKGMEDIKLIEAGQNPWWKDIGVFQK